MEKQTLNGDDDDDDNIQSLIRNWTLNKVHEFNENHCHR